MQNQKGFVKILAVVIVIIVIVAAVIYVKMNLLTITDNFENPTDDFPISESVSSSSVATADNIAKKETVDWKTYRNEKERFEMKYPANWKIKDYKGVDGNVIWTAFDPLKISYPLAFENLDLPGGLIEIRLAQDNRFVIGYEDFETVEIGQGVSAKKFEEKTDDNGPNPAWDNKHVITYYVGDKIEIRYSSNLDDKYLDTFNQIISTFRFVK